MKRFWSKVDVKGPDDCWEWMATRNRKGYGQLKSGKSSSPKKSHRVSWELTFGLIPPGLLVLHSCDNPGCVNPRHLFLGTHQSNVDDKVQKGRCPQGESHHYAKLTESQVQDIKRDPRADRIIAQEYGVSRAHIGKIQNGSSWSHTLIPYSGYNEITPLTEKL